MIDVTTVENAAMERREYMDTRPQDRYSGRRKFACCRRCGSEIGMQSVHQDTLAEMTAAEIEALEPWHQATWDMGYLYYPCPRCNREKIIPGGFYLAPLPLNRVLDWHNEGPAEPEPNEGDVDPMAPDYAALAAEPEAATAGQDSRESAGI